ncbi:MAG: trypsin-like serine protease [Kiloniellales bacterium]
MIRRATILAHALCRRSAFTAALALVWALSAAPEAARAMELAQATGRAEVNAMEYPWSAIGRVNAGGRGHCTGFLIGERRVMTAAHCLYDNREGRWRTANELHFVAGYQRDTYLIHSPVRSYSRSHHFDVTAGATMTNAIADWAVLTLEKPIGRQAGWLGLRRLGKRLLKRIQRGESRLLQAGYRRGWTHIMSVNFDCTITGFFEEHMGIAHGCDVAKGDSGSPLLVAVDGGFQVAGMHVLNGRTQAGEIAGALSIALFHPKSGVPQAIEAVRGAGPVWSGGHAPAGGGPASPVPTQTIDYLLGNLDRAPAPEAAPDRGAAIAAFESRAGLPVTGEASLALLVQLLRARQ